MESLIIGGVCLLQVAHIILRPPEPPKGPQISYERFTSLPYTLQEYIIDFLPIRSIRSVNLTSRYFYFLSTRALHKLVDFQRTEQDENDPFALPLLRYGQRNFVATVLKKPRHARWVQSLHWEMLSAAGDMNLTPTTFRQESREFTWQRDFGTDVWRAFRRLKSVKELDFRGGKWPHTLPWSHPRKPVFPALRCATIRGVLPYKALDAMLHTSTALQDLQLIGYPCEQSPDAMSSIMIPFTSPDHKSTECISIASFLQRSIDVRAFSDLRTFHYRESGEAPDEALRLTPAEMRPFLDYLSDWLEVLVIAVQDRQEEWSDMMGDALLSGNWRQLRELMIGLPLSRHKAERILKACPRLQVVRRSRLLAGLGGMMWDSL